MNNFFILLFSIIILSCGRHDDNQTKLNLEYLDKEIADRNLILNKDTSFSQELEVIRKDIENLRLLTVDIENINASIVKSNEYFNAASKRYDVDTSGFVVLYKGVPLNDIVSIIKKNHLNLLNKIIILRNKNGTLMYTAQ